MRTMLDADLLCKSLSEEVRAVCERIAAAANKGQGIEELDAVVREAMLELGDRAMCEAVAQVAADARAEVVPCPKCGRHMVFKQWRSMQMRCVTTGKPQTVKSPYVVCEHCGIGRMVVRDKLGLDRDGLTASLRQVATLAGTLEPFETAAETVLGELAGIDLSGSKVHSVCQEAGEVAQGLMKQGILGEARRLRPGETLYIEADGLMLWQDDGWHEVKLAVLFASSDRADVSKDRKLVTHRQYVVTQGDPDELGELIWQAASQWLPRDGDGAPIIRGKVVFLSDGAPWLKNMAETWLPGGRIVLDFFHVAEHLAATARVLHPTDEVARKRWCKHRRDLLLQGEVTQMLGGLLVEAKRKKITAEQRTELKHLHKYLSDRKTALCYVQQRALGLDIGSGPAESAANHVLQQRMKRAGMRWDRPGGGTMMALRCAYRSSGGMVAVAGAMARQAA